MIVGAACAFCWPVFLGRVMLPADMCLLMLPWRALQHQFPDFRCAYNPMFDPIQQYLPWRIYAVESLRAGLIPLWNPYAFCGTPFLANLQSALLYPPNLLFLLTGARHGFGVSAILHLTVGGLFMYAFLLTLGLRRAAALLGALVFMFNGFTVTWLEFPTLSLWVFMWLPAILLCYERSLRHPRSLWPALCALAVAIQFLGGHLQISAYLLLAFVLYAIVRTISHEDRAASRPAAIAIAAGSLIVGLALAAGQLLPTLELVQQTGRTPHTAAETTTTAFPLTHLILYLVPNFFGNPVHYNYWGNIHDPSAFNFFETACYVGILPLLLAAWAIRRWREPAFSYLAILTVFGFLVAIGSPLYLMLYHLAPGFRELAGLGRALCLAAFGLAGLAALGLDDLLAREPLGRARCPLLCASAAVVGLVAALLWAKPVIRDLPPNWKFGSYLTSQIIVTLCLLLASAGLVLLRLRRVLRGRVFALLALGLVILDLFGFSMKFNPFVDPKMAYPETDSVRWLREHAGHERVTSLASHGLDWMAHNSAMIFGLRDIHGSDSLRVRRSFELVSGPELDQSNYPEPESLLLDVLGVRYLMTRRPVGEGWRLAYSGEAPIYENLEALPRVHLQPVGQACPERSRREPVSCPNGSVSFARDDPDAITLKVTTDRPAQVVLTDSYYPGWRAWVDGAPATIYRVNYGFRGIPVPTGSHTVELRYEPATFRVGMFLSLLTLAALAGAAVTLYLRRRARPSATASRP